jgi:hypothetical protein
VECYLHYGPVSKIAIEWAKEEAALVGLDAVNNKYDAMRHVYWSSALIRAMGIDRAREWMEVHEIAAGTTPEALKASCMDRWNNKVGETIAMTKLWLYSDLHLQNEARNAANEVPPRTKNEPYVC